jgi:hypothetical protein
MRRNHPSSSLLLVAALTLGASMTPLSRPVQADDLGLDAFAKRVAGTYFVGFTCGGNPAKVPQLLLTLGADGTWISEGSTDHGDNPLGGVSSGQRGAWQQTGKHQLSATSLDFDFDPAGIHTGYLRWTVVITMSDDFQRLVLEGPFALFTYLQDPLDPTEVPFFELNCTGGGRRVPAVM